MKSKQEIKQALYNKVQEAQREIILHAGKAMENLDQDASEYEQEDDLYDPTKAEMRKQKDLIAEQYEKAVKEDEVLQRMDPSRISEKAEFGAVVVTNKYNMFISIGIGKVTLDDTIYYAVSTSVPVYEKIKGLKKGDAFAFNNQSFTIKDVF